jgi:hypothetical protein
VKAAKDECVSLKLYHSGNFEIINGQRRPKISYELWETCDQRDPVDVYLINQCRFAPY